MRKIICLIIIFFLAVSFIDLALSAPSFAEGETAPSESPSEDNSGRQSFSKALGKRILISSLIILPIAIILGIRSGNKKYGK